MVNEADIFLLATIIVIVLALILAFFVAYRLFKSYKETEKKPTFYMMWFFVFFIMGVLLLLIELETVSFTHRGTLPLTIEQGEFIGFVFAVLAVAASVASLLSADLFALEFLGEKYKRLIWIPIVIALVYWLLYAFGHLLYQPWFDYSWVPELEGEVLTSWNLLRPLEGLVIFFILMFVPLWFGPFIQLIATFQLRQADRPVFLRSLLITIAFGIVAWTYIFEIVEIEGIAPLMPIIRLGYVIFPIMMYLCLIMPDWFKRLLGFPT